MIKLSQGLASAMLTNYGFGLMMQYGIIDLYSGLQPDYAHWEPTGTHLGRITKDGNVFVFGSPNNGLEFDYSEIGAIKDTGDWVLSGLSEGTAGWWRFKWYVDDPDTTDPYYPRMDGEVGESLVMTNTQIYSTTSQAIDQFYLRFE